MRRRFSRPRIRHGAGRSTIVSRKSAVLPSAMRCIGCSITASTGYASTRCKRLSEPAGSLAPSAFVNFLQNHDQIGNRPFGDRLSTQVEEAALAAALAVTLLAPMPPLMFMGEEWGSTTPFPFFCDFHGALADAVRK